MRPLEGVRVLDLTQFLAGPYCTMILADMGADVIKIEPPGGEPQRLAMRVRRDEESLSFLTLNRNKRGIVINLREQAGRDLVRELVQSSDVLVENFRPGVTARLGIAYEDLRPLRPELIYASVTGFGDAGPWSDRPGFDLVAQGMSGLMSVTGEPDGEPVKVGVPVTDLTSGLFATIGVLSAYAARQRTGDGQRVSTSLWEAGVALGVHESTEYWSTGRVPGRLGSRHRFGAPYEGLRTADGSLIVGAGTQRHWERFCEVIERQDLLTDPRFSDHDGRMGHRDELQAELERTLSTAPTAVWVERLVAEGIVAGPILDYAELLEAEHTRESAMVVEVDHPQLGRVKTLGTPIKLSDSVAEYRAAPLLGEHTDEILAEFGVAPDRVAALRAQSIL